MSDNRRSNRSFGGRMSSKEIKKNLVRLAYKKPELRDKFLPMIRVSSSEEAEQAAAAIEAPLSGAVYDEMNASASVRRVTTDLFDNFLSLEIDMRNGAEIELEFTVTGTRGQVVDLTLSHLVVNGDYKEPNQFGLNIRVDDCHFDQGSKRFDRSTTQALRNIAEAAEQAKI